MWAEGLHNLLFEFHYDPFVRMSLFHRGYIIGFPGALVKIIPRGDPCFVREIGYAELFQDPRWSCHRPRRFGLLQTIDLAR